MYVEHLSADKQNTLESHLIIYLDKLLLIV